MSSLPFPPAGSPASTQAFGGRLADRLRALSGARTYALADQVVYSFGNMVVAATLSRHCPALQFGVYILTQRAMDVLIQLSNVLLWKPLVFRLPTLSSGEQTSYRGSTVVLQLGFCLVFTALLALIAWVTAGGGHPLLHGTFTPLVLTAAMLLFREFTRNLYFAHMRFREAFWTDFATVALQIMGVCTLGWTGQLGVRGTLNALCAGACCVNVWWLVRDWSQWRINLSRVAVNFRQNFRMGRWLLGGSFTALVSAQWNPWLLSAVLGGGSVGVYAICESLVNIPRTALTSMQNAMEPTVARAYVRGGRSAVMPLVRRLNQQLVFTAMGCAVVIWAVAPVAARLIYGKTPGQLGFLVPLLLVNLVVYICNQAQNYGLTAFGHADATLYANASGLLLQATVSVFLIRHFGLAGAALALFAGNAAVVGVRQMLYRRRLCGREQPA